jgi:hypothetical protein
MRVDRSSSKGTLDDSHSSTRPRRGPARRSHGGFSHRTGHRRARGLGRACPARVWRHRSTIPVKGMGNLTSVVAAGRTQAWAGGFKVSSLVGHPSTAVRGDFARTATSRAGTALDLCQELKKMFPTLMLRWNGHSWSSVTMPAVGRINFLRATGRNDVWATADCAMLHWDGRRWTSMSYPAIPGAQQSSAELVGADGPKDAWLIGGTYDSRTQISRGTSSGGTAASRDP